MLHCFVGGDISFECPCAEELDFCSFKKLSQEGYIVRGGLLNSQHFKYELNERRTHITLKECHEEDEGTYVWMCGKCNVNRQFHLEVQNFGNKTMFVYRILHLMSTVRRPNFIIKIIKLLILYIYRA